MKWRRQRPRGTTTRQPAVSGTRSLPPSLASAPGFALHDDDLRQHVLDSALSQFPVIGEQLSDPSGLRGSGVAIAIGAITACTAHSAWPRRCSTP